MSRGKPISVFNQTFLRNRRLAAPAWAWLFVIPAMGAHVVPASADTHSEAISAILEKADADYGEYLSGQCVTCHHAQGKSDGIPSILGLPDVYFVQTILEYKNASEERTNPTMVNIAKNLSDEEIGSLAKYFSAQKAD